MKVIIPVFIILILGSVFVFTVPWFPGLLSAARIGRDSDRIANDIHKDKDRGI
jgi:hypothetical protein